MDYEDAVREVSDKLARMFRKTLRDSVRIHAYVLRTLAKRDRLRHGWFIDLQDDLIERFEIGLFQLNEHEYLMFHIDTVKNALFMNELGKVIQVEKKITRLTDLEYKALNPPKKKDPDSIGAKKRKPINDDKNRKENFKKVKSILKKAKKTVVFDDFED